MMDINYRTAEVSELSEIIILLDNNNLPTADISSSDIKLFVGDYNNSIIGVIGIEIYSRIGLLRSLAVDDNFKNLNIGKTLVINLLSYCKQNYIESLYLLTETAERYFEKFGFITIDRSIVPETIKQSKEYKEICPVSAVIMQAKMK